MDVKAKLFQIDSMIRQYEINKDCAEDHRLFDSVAHYQHRINELLVEREDIVSDSSYRLVNR